MEATPERTNRVDTHDTADDILAADAAMLRLSGDDIPVEPAAMPEQAAADATRTRRELLAFHLYGRRPDSVDPALDKKAIPALLHRYRDLSAIRHDYPVCVDGDSPKSHPDTLSRIIDDVISEVGGEGDDAAQMQRDIYRMEAVMRAMADSEPGQRLSEVWELATRTLMSTSELSDEARDRFVKHVASARDALDVDGELLPCSTETAARLFGAIGVVDWRRRTADWNVELASLIGNLNDILLVDAEHSDEALSPEHLGDTLGTNDDDFDPEAMSAILAESPHAEQIPATRRKRIESALSKLRQLQPVFDLSVSGSEPFNARDVVTTCSDAQRTWHERAETMVDFFKAVRIARMESSNGYREEVHDGFFNSFDMTCLTEEELQLFPPVLAHVDGDALRGGEVDALLSTLAAGATVRVLVTLDDLCAAEDGSTVSVGWWARVPGLAMALNHAYALQAPMSDLAAVRRGLIAGFACDSPALFGVYTGEKQVSPPYSPYLAAAAATEARLVPVITYDPSAGETMAHRVDVTANPQHELDWPAAPFRYRSSENEEQSVDLRFTTADFLFFDPRLRRHFWTVDPAHWHADMIPIAEYLELAPEDIATRIPYLLAVDDDGSLDRVVMTREVVDEVERQRAYWRGVQELGGINNSFAKRRVAEERERLEEEKQQEIDAVEKRYLDQLEQDLGGLTHEIVQRIASRLISDEGFKGAMPAAAAVTSRPAAAPAAGESAPEAAAVEAVEEVAEAEVEEDDDDIGGLDDAYIDTPLCTTCNECTGINSQIFAYNENKQAFIKDPAGGPYKDIVRAAELCPVHIIHPGKPKNPQEPDLEDWIKRAEPFS